MTSQAKLPFITLKMKPNEYHQLMPTLLDYAKTKGLYDYVVGNETVKSSSTCKINPRFPSTAPSWKPRWQSKKQLMLRWFLRGSTVTHCTLTILSSPSMQSTLYDLLNWKLIVHATQCCITKRATKNTWISQANLSKHLVQQPEPSNASPSMSFIGYGGIIDQETDDAANVVCIRKHDYDDIANQESRITPSIQRYHPDTDLTDHDVYTKLTPANTRSQTRLSK